MTKNRISYTLTVTLIAIALLFVGGVVHAKTTGDRVPGGDTVISGCVIRFNPDRTGQPEIHSNNSHLCAGVTKVGIAKNGRLRVIQSTAPAVKNPIIFAVCQHDETLTSRGIICGPTGGTNHTEFQFYDTKLNRPLNLKKRADRLRLAGKSSNVWVGWVHAPGYTR